MVDRREAAAAVGRMVSALARRGPDGEGVDVWDGAALGHRRLAIFDLSEAGRQPMVSEDGRVGVVFNGAIYNFLGLREDCARTCGRPATSSAATPTLKSSSTATASGALMASFQG
jgi:asparagine synthetase B (glutamine-hydrolysing)